MNGVNLGCLVFWVLLLQYIYLIYFLALKKAMKHCDFMSSIKIFWFIPVTETYTIMDLRSVFLIPVAALIALLLCVWYSYLQHSKVCMRLLDQEIYFRTIFKSLKCFSEVQVQ